MTQVEYDTKMKELNNSRRHELTPLYQEMNRIEQEKSIINQQMDALRSKSRELGSKYLQLCTQAKEVKDKYAQRKQELYGNRPTQLPPQSTAV